ncbi:MAG: hypothetical protein II668_08350 [Oscillospiraceae bacterium]|nr:hypothetical protein [Oscillospiraceae bacterium]
MCRFIGARYLRQCPKNTCALDSGFLKSRILSESRGGKRIDYVYAKDGLIGFYYAGEPFLYERSVQGEVVRIYDKYGSVVAEYAYCQCDPVNKADPSGHMPNWAKWLIGGIAFIGAVALTCLTGGALAPVFIGMAVSVIGGGLLQGAITAANGGDFWDGFAHGAADGAMWGGILAFAGAGLRTIQMFRHGVALGENMNRVRMLASSGRQVTYHGMPGFKIISKIFGAETAEKLALAHNARFIQRMMKWGVTLVDYGIDVARASRSVYYAMECGLVGGYEFLETMFFLGGFR